MVSQSVRRLVADRAGKSCEYCKSQENYAPQPFSVEHIYPQSLGGKSLLDNLALSCQGCNNAKYTKTEARDPVTGQLVPLFHPRHDRWSDHFAWNYDYTLVVGITAIGRATVSQLKLNRQGLINMRRVLYSVSLHPP